MDINQAATAVEEFVKGFADQAGKRAHEVRVRPSGDDAQAIKVWADLGPNLDDAACRAWADALETAAGAVAAGFTLEIRVESL